MNHVMKKIVVLQSLYSPFRFICNFLCKYAPPLENHFNENGHKVFAVYLHCICSLV